MQSDMSIIQQSIVYDYKIICVIKGVFARYKKKLLYSYGSRICSASFAGDGITNKFATLQSDQAARKLTLGVSINSVTLRRKKHYT